MKEKKIFLFTKRSTKFELFNHEVPLKGSKVLLTRRRGIYQMKDIANMDQTPLPFVMDDGKTNADKGSSEVWCATHGSVLDRRQCSVQLTIFADGKSRAKPLVIFRGKGLRIKSKD